jgi:putative peptidoglycan lipid II flippase
MCAVLWLAAGTDVEWLLMSATARAGRLAGLTAVGAATYFAALWLLGFRLADFSRRA